MGAYNNMDNAIAGLGYGISGRKEVESWRAGEDIEFGSFLFAYEGEDYSDGQGTCYKAKQDTATITLDADFVVDNTITTTITLNGVAQTPVATPWNTNHNTTMDDHKADLETAFTGLSVTLTDATTNRQFTLLYKGNTMNTITSVITGGGSQANITIVYSTSQKFIGVALFTQTGYKDTTGKYESDDAVNVLTYGQIWVLAALAVNAQEDAYVIYVPTDQGKVTNVSSGNYDIKAKIRSNTSGAGLVLIEVRGQQ